MGDDYRMYNETEIMQFINLVAELSDPDRIILYGSYAYGNPSDKSDIDLLVIKNGKDISIDDETELAVAIFDTRCQRKMKIRSDIFLRTDEQAKIIAERGGALKDALERGRVVYERAQLLTTADG